MQLGHVAHRKNLRHAVKDVCTGLPLPNEWLFRNVLSVFLSPIFLLSALVKAHVTRSVEAIFFEKLFRRRSYQTHDVACLAHV